MVANITSQRQSVIAYFLFVDDIYKAVSYPPPKFFLNLSLIKPVDSATKL